MIYCTSDLHGIPLEDLQQLLEKVHFVGSDYLFILGDVIDRGEHGVDILRWLLVQPNVQLLLGNHEAMLLSCQFIFDEISEESIAALDEGKMALLSTWMENGGDSTLRALRRLKAESPEACADIIDYLEEAPLYETVTAGGKDFLLCHAGFEHFDKQKKLRDYSREEWLWSRPNPDADFYADVITVFGHTPTAYYSPAHSGKILRTDTWIDIDTGLRSTALLRLDDLQEFYL